MAFSLMPILSVGGVGYTGHWSPSGEPHGIGRCRPADAAVRLWSGSGTDGPARLDGGLDDPRIGHGQRYLGPDRPKKAEDGDIAPQHPSPKLLDPVRSRPGH